MTMGKDTVQPFDDAAPSDTPAAPLSSPLNYRDTGGNGGVSVEEGLVCVPPRFVEGGLPTTTCRSKFPPFFFFRGVELFHNPLSKTVETASVVVEERRKER